MMVSVSRRRVALVLAAFLLGGSLLCARTAIGGAVTLSDELTGMLAPSEAPALLGPITSAGRVGWECKPERAAAAARADEAELPSLRMR